MFDPFVQRFSNDAFYYKIICGPAVKIFFLFALKSYCLVMPCLNVLCWIIKIINLVNDIEL